jgi:AcrR family transcriptional regulator
MRRANAQLQSDRRTAILDAAQRCFVKFGFHQASMQAICAEAGMSPGNIYRYFPSKEAIIAAIAERDMAQAGVDFAAVQEAPDFFTGFAKLGRQYIVERPVEELGLCAEIRAESLRNPEITRIQRTIDAQVKAGLIGMLRAAEERGEIARDLDLDKFVTVLLAIGDGIEAHRASDPDFDVEALWPIVLDLIHHMLFSPSSKLRKAEESHHEG